MDTKDCDTLYDYHMECLTSFYNLISLIDSPASTSTIDKQSLNEFQENLNKYKVWAGNVGAGNRGEYWTLSLDFRLQEAAFLRSQVIRLIESLTRTVKKARSLLDGTRIPFDQSELFIPLTKSVEPYETEASGDESPWEISDDSSNSGCGADDPSDMNQKDYPHDVARNNTNAPTTEMGQVLKSTKLIIECLYKLPLRKPAPIDRVRRFRGRDVSLYQHFDVLYVRDKFPHAENYLVERLGKLISRRRQLLEYRVTHTERLRPPMSSQIKADGHQLGIPHGSLNDSSSQVTGTQNRKSAIRESSFLGQSFDDLPSAITKATIQSPAEAVTTLDLLYPPSVTESRMSTSSEYTENHKLEIPPRPVNDAGYLLVHFECPYCGLAKSIKIGPSRAWESHVLRDLEPYVCTFQDCDMFDHMFDSRQAWFTHESELHRAKWSCNACASEMDTTSAHLTFETKDIFTSHMSLVHKLPKHKLDRLAESFRHPNARVDGYCCLCGKHAQKLKAHLGRHMEVIALFALPRPSLQESDDSGKALADPCHGSSKGLPSESGHDSGSRSSLMANNNPAHDESPVATDTAWPISSLQPKAPDPLSDPNPAIKLHESKNERFPRAIWDMSPLDACDILRVNLESILLSTNNESAPTPSTSPGLPPSNILPHLQTPEQSGDLHDVALRDKRSEAPHVPLLPMPFDQELFPDMKVDNHKASTSCHPATNKVIDVQPDASGESPVEQQHESIVRKFRAKNPPSISIQDYLARLHQYCPLSTAVYLATSLQLTRLAVEEEALPINNYTIHRAVLAGLRIYSKALEDLSYPHKKVAKVGGVSESELCRLEISFSFLTGFNLYVSNEELQSHYDGLRKLVEDDIDRDGGKAW